MWPFIDYTRQGVLKHPNDLMDLTSEGKLIQSAGALNIKAVLPTDFLNKAEQRASTDRLD